MAVILEAKKKVWTAQDLFNSTIQVAGWRKEYSSSKSRKLRNIVPYVGTRSILYHFESMGMTQKSLHQIYIFFSDLTISERANPKLSKIEYHGDVYWAEKPNLKKNPIRVRCSCYDFYFVYALWNFKEGALWGDKPRPYKRKTTTRPERNPRHYPGMCKHLVNALLLMQTLGHTSGDIARLNKR